VVILHNCPLKIIINWIQHFPHTTTPILQLSLFFFFAYFLCVSIAPKVDLISDISSSKENWNIKVRVVRLWFVRDMKRDQLPNKKISTIPFFFLRKKVRIQWYAWSCKLTKELIMKKEWMECFIQIVTYFKNIQIMTINKN